MRKLKASVDSLISLIRGLTSVQQLILLSIVERFLDGCEGKLVSKDFLSETAFQFFATRLSVHHAYSSSILKKENFEHILFEIFKKEEREVRIQNSMTVRGADLIIDGMGVSLKTEAARNLNWNYITISKLMEAAWIKEIKTLDDIPKYLKTMVLPHFKNYERIFILRANPDPENSENIRYEFREIPKTILEKIGQLTPADFTPLTPKRSTRAPVILNGKQAFVFRIDGSDDKLTINKLEVNLCPLHAWWSLKKPD